MFVFFSVAITKYMSYLWKYKQQNQNHKAHELSRAVYYTM